MYDVHEFLRSLTIVLAVAAVTTVVFQRLRQPVVLGYIIAGLIVGPHVPIPLVADRGIVQTLSELGVILLMFSLGLEFSFAKLARVGPPATFTAVIQCGVMVWLGYLGGQLFGWTQLESIFAGAVIAISSTTIIAKVFDEQAVGGRLRELVVGILLVEDLIAIVFMAALTAIGSGAGLSAGALAATIGRLAVFLVVLLAVGVLVVPRLIRVVIGLGRAETTLVASVGICFAVAYIAQSAGYSVALGAFLAGSLVAESGHGDDVEHLVHPVRDLFAAIFFVSVGMLIDPGLVLEHWAAVMVFTVLVIVGTIASVTTAAFLSGAGIRTAVQAGMSLAQIGEFSFIIASLGIALGTTRDFLYTVAVAVSAITTLTTPWLVRAAGPFAAYIDRKLPHRFQTLAALYGTWLERLGTPSPSAGRTTGVARFIRLLILDGAVLSALIVAVGVWLDTAAAAVDRAIGTGPELSQLTIVAAACACSIPLIFGVGRLSRLLGTTLATAALPQSARPVDLDAAPRRALTLTLQLAIAIVVAVVVLAITQPFLPSYAGPLVFVAMVGGFMIAIWRSAIDLEGHVRAGAQAIVEAFTAARMEPSVARARTPSRAQPAVARTVSPMAAVAELLPGLGVPIAVELDDDSPCVGQSLAQLNLRGRTGATVLAIIRPDAPVLAPAATEQLRSGDVLALTGTQDAIDTARTLLVG